MYAATHACRSVQRGVQRGAFSPTSGATPAPPTLGATPKLLSATPKDFVPSEKAKRITISGAAAPSHFGHLIFRNIKVSLTTLNAAGWQLSLTVLSLVASNSFWKGEGGAGAKKLHSPHSGVSFYNLQCICVTKIPL